MWFSFPFILLMEHVTLIEFQVLKHLEPSLPSRDLLVMLYSHFNVLLNSVSKYVVEGFTLASVKNVVSSFPASLSGFSVRLMLTSGRVIWSLLSTSVFGKFGKDLHFFWRASL